MKKIVICILILFCGISCQEDNNIFNDLTDKGGFVAFEETPSSSFNLLDLASFEINSKLIDLNNNATSYNLDVEYEGVTIEDFFTANSFPSDFAITLPMLLDTFGLTEGDLTIASEFNFTATVTTSAGVFSGGTPSFNSDTNEEEGGNTAINLLGLGYKNAFSFRVSFFVPPPKKLRGTSFEEPFATDDRYTRSDAVAVGELLNNPEERHVMHTAVGDGIDDEIGFRSFFADPNNGVSSPGFTSEQIGVSNDGGPTGGTFLDGDQAYQIEDTDGTIRIEFDRVPIDASQNPITGIQIQYYPIGGNNREDDDFIRITAIVERAEGSETLELLNIDGLTVNDGLDRWNLIDSGFLNNVTAYTLIVEIAVDGGSEDTYFDQMLVYIPG